MENLYADNVIQELEIETEEITQTEEITLMAEMTQTEEMDDDSKVETPPAKRKQTITLEGQKKEVAKQVRRYSCLWDKKDRFYRNLVKRNAAWDNIAKTMNISVTEAKNLWKKARDTHRYLSQKAKNSTKAKSGDAAPEEGDEAQEEDHDIQELQEEMSFLDNNLASSLRQTVSLGGDSATPRPSTAATIELDESSCDAPSTSSNYSYMANKNKRDRKDSSMEAALLVCQSISSFIEKRDEKAHELKHIHIWLQMEKLFEQLDEDKITDLNFQFISQTYNAILEKRGKRKKL